MNDLPEKQPADEKLTELQAAKVDLKQAKAALKAARKSASQAKEHVKTLKANLKNAAVKKVKKTGRSD